ncbi:MAG: PHP domain-containing protein [Syntrophomonadaceae bacterium]|nr:PHP domain-containing protein [Syntrophomonadaceae bacterium]
MTFKIDLHVHSRYSFDCSVNPEHLIKWGKKRGMDAICITDHNSYLSSAPIEEVAKDSGLIVLRGAEASTSCGHLILYGVQDDSWNKQGLTGQLDPQRLIDYVNDQGGAVIAAHPFRKGEEHSGGWRMAKLRGLAAIDVWNLRCTDEENRQAVELAKEMGLPMVGGSDAHAAVEVGLAYSIVNVKVNSIQDLVIALKKGWCRVGKNL